MAKEANKETKKGPRHAPRGRRSTTETPSSSALQKIIRPVAIIATATVLGLGAYEVKNALTSTDSQPPAPVQREVVPEDITLGNVHFFIQTPDVAAEKRKELFHNMQEAYKKLVGYFGQEIMTMDAPIEFPIIIRDTDQASTGYIDGETVWNMRTKVKAGTVYTTTPTTPDHLMLRTTSEQVIAHEFVHLFVQPAGLLPESFHEGHAGAIEKILYDRPATGVEANALRPDVLQMLSIPLDFFTLDKDHNRGIQNNFLWRVLQFQWHHLWREFGARNPDFFRTFYAEVNKRRKAGTDIFAKKEVLEIARSASPHFHEWYEKTAISMHEMGESGPQTSITARILNNGSSIAFTNFNITPRRFLAEGMELPSLTAAIPGTVSFSYKDPSTKEIKTSEVNTTDTAFGIAPIPAHILNEPSFKIMIGNQEVPLQR